MDVADPLDDTVSLCVPEYVAEERTEIVERVHERLLDESFLEDDTVRDNDPTTIFDRDEATATRAQGSAPFELARLAFEAATGRGGRQDATRLAIGKRTPPDPPRRRAITPHVKLADHARRRSR